MSFINNLKGGVGIFAESLGLKGFISLACLSFGIAGVAIGANTSYKMDELTKIYKNEKDKVNIESILDKNNKRLQEAINTFMKEYADDQEDVKTLIKKLHNIAEKLEKTIGNVNEGIKKEIGIINDKIDAFNLVTVIEKWTSDIKQMQSDQVTFSGSDELKEIVKQLTEIKDELLNNQSELVDINNQTFEILEILRDKKEKEEKKEVKNVESFSNLIQIDINNTVKSANTIRGFNNGVEFEYITHGSVDQSSFDDQTDNISTYHWLVESEENGSVDTEIDGYSNLFDVNYDSSSVELNFYSSSNEISGSLSKVEIIEQN